MILAEGAIIREFVMVSNWRFLISDYLVDVVTLVNQKVFALQCPKKETDMGLQCHLSEMQQCFHLEILRLYLVKGSKSIFSIPNVASDLNVKWDLTNYLLSDGEDERNCNESWRKKSSFFYKWQYVNFINSFAAF